MSNIEDKYQYVVRKIGDDDEYEDKTFIGLTPEAGRYQGVIYEYGKVSIAEEENPNGTMPFQFEFNIIDACGHPQQYFKEDFTTLMGDILVDIIEKDDEWQQQ